MALTVVYARDARKALVGIGARDRERILLRVEAYAAVPDAASHDVRTLVAQQPGFRLRVGVWRVLFDRSETTMDIRYVLHRREAYR